jgi:hypothetical protein
MSSTSTTRLGLFKPVSGSGEPFRTSDVNSNWDKVDAEAVAADARLDTLELAVGSSGTVQNAVLAASATSATLAGKATNVAGGALGRIPIQSAADTTIFVAAATGGGKFLSSSPSSPYASWSDPTPFKLQVGSTSGTGSFTVTFATAFDFAPIVTCTALAASTPTIITVTGVSTTGFTVKVWDQSASSPYQFGAATSSRTVYWNAVQYSSSQAAS